MINGIGSIYRASQTTKITNSMWPLFTLQWLQS